jgi:hypothetical protein
VLCQRWVRRGGRTSIEDENEDDNDLFILERIAFGANRRAGSLCYFTPWRITTGPRETVFRMTSGYRLILRRAM